MHMFEQNKKNNQKQKKTKMTLSKTPNKNKKQQTHFRPFGGNQKPKRTKDNRTKVLTLWRKP